MFRARPNLVRPSEVSAKVQTVGRSRNHDPGNYCPRSANATPRPRTTNREPGNASRPRNPRVPRPMHPSEPGKRPASGREFHRPNLHRPTTPADHDPSDPDRSDSATPDCPADRPARPSQRRGRPEALFEAQIMFSSPA
ncbi:unnamed protein product [Microthlaspi erraticum]|uniref:Uncharacterized protein n=1 Tax=Microthlaspi erraticum TaxID=1685480 RepID=A0A6D2KKP1_9BRAS|nr:unnamed protein product [Microthlaspi erraticum]